MTNIPVGLSPSRPPPFGIGATRSPLSSTRAQRAFSERLKPTPVVSLTSGIATPEQKSPRAEPLSASATPRLPAPHPERTPSDDAPQPGTPTTARTPRSELAEQRIANFAKRKSASPQKTYRYRRSAGQGSEQARSLAESPSESLSMEQRRFALPEKRPPRTQQTDCGIGRRLDSPGSFRKGQDAKASLAESRTIQSVLERADLLQKRAALLEEQVQLLSTAEAQIADMRQQRRTVSDQSGASIGSTQRHRASRHETAAEKPGLQFRNPDNVS